MADCYTDLEKAVVVLVENFYKYVSKHSLVKNKISKSSFRKMLKNELNHMLTILWSRGGPHSHFPCQISGLCVRSHSLADPRFCRQDTGNRKAADKLIQNLDANHDGRISFDEYWTMIGGIMAPIANLIRQQEQQCNS
ncbi:protein S100-A16 isoform X1 [Erinaceus europaeus]|uniref:Protein S100 n=1 Tax=Erinaceus europaeus TaxID=9365 RepID=A0ABM3Y8M5_ERIEU|nr:protein S100-A16 isoform X1 [Erinaceus europaeus]XP_060057427.1 protein S100-A16 isoform X1 [Erinaceus europaeus]